VRNIYIENEKNKIFDPKESLPNDIMVWALEVPVGSPTVKNEFPFFNLRKKKFTPQNDVVLGRFQPKKITRVSP